ncbi:MAG: NifU family protein [Candidatus Paceibacterota bacterium]|jgi:Fe-S cluster biogenesis protein NfuA
MENISDNQIEKKIEDVLIKVRPFIQSHGGDVSFVGVKNGKAVLSISGRCAHCALADLTFNHMVKDMIQEAVPEIKKIEFQNTHTL